ncbi:hypothetical protein [Mesorhizobium sp. M2C.T.Ca.TU.002.02.1.1]|uniref:hypothetical protein n=1 Tax=Mesorhizobium sp. M2C.T.Ca.TU.002.02.1.1 TaxID=2496788 RepID=UPI0013E30144|nr:hypothetical protein [Mesorhizobium sp. M2C.T.Ca.TU.002.02.1.1]
MMRIISNVEGGFVRGVGAGGTKGAGLVSMKHAPLSEPNVVTDKTGVHVTERQRTVATSRRNVTDISR